MKKTGNDIEFMSGEKVSTNWNNEFRHVFVTSTHFDKDPKFNDPIC